jgi:hypothetical protein
MSQGYQLGGTEAATFARGLQTALIALRESRYRLCGGSCVNEQGHEARVHVVLLVAVKECIARIGCHQIGFHFGSRLYDHHVFINPAHGGTLN